VVAGWRLARLLPFTAKSNYAPVAEAAQTNKCISLRKASAAMEKMGKKPAEERRWQTLGSI